MGGEVAVAFYRRPVYVILGLPLLAGTAHAADDFRVAMVLPGSIADGGWNQQAYEGLKKLEGTPGFKVAYTENVKQSDIPQVVGGYADDGYDMIIGHGFQFGSLFQEIGPEYAKQKFFATTYAPQGKIRRTSCISTRATSTSAIVWALSPH